MKIGPLSTFKIHLYIGMEAIKNNFS